MLVAGIGAMLVVNLVLMRRAFAPLNTVRDLMQRFDPLRPGRRLPTDGLDPEIRELTTTFNAMLERLETERRESSAARSPPKSGSDCASRRSSTTRSARAITGLLLLLERASPDRLPADCATASEARHAARSSLERAATIVRAAAPEALDELGLQSAWSRSPSGSPSRAASPVARQISSRLARIDPRHGARHLPGRAGKPHERRPPCGRIAGGLRARALAARRDGCA